MILLFVLLTIPTSDALLLVLPSFVLSLLLRSLLGVVCVVGTFIDDGVGIEDTEWMLDGLDLCLRDEEEIPWIRSFAHASIADDDDDGKTERS